VASTVGIVFEDTLEGQGNDSNDYSCSDSGRDAEDLTLAWTAPSTGCFQFTASSSDSINMIVALFDECSLGVELACGEETGFYEDASIQFDAVAHTTYAIVVDTVDDDTASLVLSIDACGADSPGAIPDDWVCLASRYGGDQGCDCGCGVLDPDCADESVDSCDNCGPINSCSDSNCNALDRDRNWTCDERQGSR
jgi:hypothetical protein